MKKKRQETIIELISKYPIETQEELTNHLNQLGFQTTQATVSRDIRELELTKIHKVDGKQTYGLVGSKEKEVSTKYQRILEDAISSLEVSENMLVVKTVSGMAMACAAALDALEIEGLLGSIAGDDTIFCVLKSNKIGKEVIHQIQTMIYKTEE
ncbi:MAG: arginine repressor [Anaerostipes sp.]|jgi:transcriptional regulator of arginine metabolism|nr:arginine repressor [Anaerostipes sp.]MDD3747000.1 arginine repressor [Anaerostipes sp.]